MSRTIYTIIEEDSCTYIYVGEDFRAKILCDFGWGEITSLVGNYYDNLCLTGEEVPEEIVIYRDLSDGKLKLSER